MTEKISYESQEKKMPAFPRYWLVIILFWLTMGGYFINHLLTETPPTRVAFNIAPLDLDVFWYGIIITSGILLGTWVVADLAEKRGLDPDHVWNGVMWCVIFGLVGARLYHVLTPPPSMAALGITSPTDYFRQPWQLINLRAGGLGIYGGIVGGALGLLIYAWRNGLNAWIWADLAVVGLALGQAIGRWGNFFNQELFGQPVNLPWAIPIEFAHRPNGYTEFTHFHPAFLYESLWNFLAFIVLWRMASRSPRPKALTATYLIFYALGRTLTELVRLDSPTFLLFNWQIPIASAVSVIIMLVAVAMLTRKQNQAERTIDYNNR
jgi:phosphatidylglycerol:prolipoprotein diacylglycerol transferase